MSEKQSITSSGMLVRLYQRGWSGRKYDPKESEELVQRHCSASDEARVNKLLVPKELLSPIQRHDGEWKRWHYSQTLPYDEPYRILCAVNFFAYRDGSREREDERRRLVEKLKASLPQALADAPRRLNGLLKPGDLPTAEEVLAKFDAGVEVTPIPDSSAFRVFLDGEAEDLARQIDRARDERIRDAMRDVWQRVADCVGRMHERLSAYRQDEESGRVEGVFRDSLVENVRELVELLPRLNLTGDGELARLGAEMKGALCWHEAEELRSNEAARRGVAEEAQRILARVNEYL